MHGVELSHEMVILTWEHRLAASTLPPRSTLAWTLKSKFVFTLATIAKEEAKRNSLLSTLSLR